MFPVCRPSRSWKQACIAPPNFRPLDAATELAHEVLAWAAEGQSRSAGHTVEATVSGAACSVAAGAMSASADGGHAAVATPV
eukprot:1861031-Alexandrium_andersonii.AAC.1